MSSVRSQAGRWHKTLPRRYLQTTLGVSNSESFWDFFLWILDLRSLNLTRRHFSRRKTGETETHADDSFIISSRSGFDEMERNYQLNNVVDSRPKPKRWEFMFGGNGKFFRRMKRAIWFRNKRKCIWMFPNSLHVWISSKSLHTMFTFLSRPAAVLSCIEVKLGEKFYRFLIDAKVCFSAGLRALLSAFSSLRKFLIVLLEKSCLHFHRKSIRKVYEFESQAMRCLTRNQSDGTEIRSAEATSTLKNF